MDEREFKERTLQLGLRIIRLYRALPKNGEAAVIGKQLLRSGTSVGANYRAACRGRSSADVLSRLAVAEEEADETLYWLELLAKAEVVPMQRLTPLMKEVDEVVSMLVASIKTLRSRAQPGASNGNGGVRSIKMRSPANRKSKIENPKSEF